MVEAQTVQTDTEYYDIVIVGGGIVFIFLATVGIIGVMMSIVVVAVILFLVLGTNIIFLSFNSLVI